MLLLSAAAGAGGIDAAVPVEQGAHLALDDWSGGSGGNGNSSRDGGGSDHMGLEMLNMFKNFIVAFLANLTHLTLFSFALKKPSWDFDLFHTVKLGDKEQFEI